LIFEIINLYLLTTKVAKKTGTDNE